MVWPCPQTRRYLKKRQLRRFLGGRGQERSGSRGGPEAQRRSRGPEEGFNIHTTAQPDLMGSSLWQRVVFRLSRRVGGAGVWSGGVVQGTVPGRGLIANSWG
ncbi:hypothetical protein EYF80_026770 [Liparis tanakae]|uniref:Uncharacterized protein n=1 Tax=Liparis tanakae TaxID=230148 RepID=A0A4Z2HE33_9TELE|nr:hypothetical protein EYF80_026770 [Liparis tanakae]